MTEREATETLSKMERKFAIVLERNKHVVPYITKDGRFVDYSADDKIGWWTNGFWGGLLWQMAALTGKACYRESAIELETKMDKVLMDAEAMDHDSGFRWLPTAVAHYRYDKNPQSLNRALLAANNMAGRFNVKGNFIRAWNNWGTGDKRGWAIIDCMMNLPLLYWASEETKDPRFQMIAVKHADTALDAFVREDGSVNHIVEFDFLNGGVKKTYGGQGYCEGSAWTRGQGWGIYGFALSYLHTKDARYLEASKRIATYFIEHIPDSGLIPCDFQQPAEPNIEDSTASAIAICGLLELSKFTTGEKRDLFTVAANTLLNALLEKRCSFDTNVDYFLTHCAVAYHAPETNQTFVYADYFLVEALMKLAGKEYFIW